MSRSKRAPIWTEGYGGKGRKFSKKKANQKVKNADDVGNGANYKRYYNSWNIIDYKIYDKKNKKVTRK